MKKFCEYLTDSDGEFGEEEFLKFAKIKSEKNPAYLTHGVKVVVQPQKRIAFKKEQTQENQSQESNIDYEIDSFRCKFNKDRKNIIQIVENKSLKGIVKKEHEYDKWIKKVRIKAELLKKLQKSILENTQDSVTITVDHKNKDDSEKKIINSMDWKN